MAIKTNKYELSLWKEELGDNGTKIETKLYIIGADDMNYEGRATSIKFTKKSNGTHTLTFQMPDSFFDSEQGKYVDNEFTNELFAERKIKFLYKDKWYEFFIKSVKETKKHKSLMKEYSCSDAFIDELSRNGYGITFDEELYNNVEEIGTFTEEILEDSIWKYAPEYNWGDFTEYQEEKLFKIPISLFNSLKAYKLNFNIDSNLTIENVFTKESRLAEMGDDLARKQFWDIQGGTNPLMGQKIDVPNNGYIYVPYSCLNFCYTNVDNPNEIDNSYKVDLAATETAQSYPNDDLNRFALAPTSVNPKAIIQFLAFEDDDILEIDENGLILNKDYTYFITVQDWNQMVQGWYWYIFEDTRRLNTTNNNSAGEPYTISKTLKYITNNVKENSCLAALGNKIVYSEGYLSEHNQTDIVKGKKISIVDRSELNISEDVDQYVTVYNNKATEYKGLYKHPEWNEDEITDKYRVCSKIGTRQIIPQLARNYLQNGIDISSTDGWEIMSYIDNAKVQSAQISLRYLKTTGQLTNDIKQTYLYYQPPKADAALVWNTYNKNGPSTQAALRYSMGDMFFNLQSQSEGSIKLTYAGTKDDFRRESIKMPKNLDELQNTEEDFWTGKQKLLYTYPSSNGTIQVTYSGIQEQTNNIDINEQVTDENCSVINFGIVGQEKIIEKGKIYCLGLSLISQKNDITVMLGKGITRTNGEYIFDNDCFVTFNNIFFTNSNWGSIKVKDSNYNVWDLIDDSNFELIDNKVTCSPQEVFILFSVNKEIENPYLAINSKGKFLLQEAYLFEAYTKGIDEFKNAHYRYSGRDLFGDEQPNNTNNKWKTYTQTGSNIQVSYSGIATKEQMQDYILFEKDIMQGSTYSYQQYFIQRLYTNDKKSFDTMGQKAFLSEDGTENSLPLLSSKYSENEYEIQTNYIDMNKCEYYKNNAAANECDCCFNFNGKDSNVCLYQRYGYCPYRFNSEKHCRRIRTLKGSKSNRFNLTQELSKVFKVYPIYYTDNEENGYIKKDENGTPQKLIFYITEKGVERPLGFRYEKNLTSINRTIKSDQIVTKLYVEDVDSELSKTGLCSIKTAEDNPSKDSFIIDLSYYTEKGVLDSEMVEKDLYGINKDSNDIMLQGYLKKLGYYNTIYDEFSNKIINLQDASYTELEANLKVNLEAIETSFKQLRKYSQSMERYKDIKKNNNEENQSYLNYQIKYSEQQAILTQLIKDTFFSVDMPDNDQNPSNWYNSNFENNKEEWIDQHKYSYGMLGQFNSEFLQIEAWKKQRAAYLAIINKLSLQFFKKYEPYLKEGTWSDSNYLTDNAYYHGALDVAAQGAIPKVQYSISVLDISVLPEYEDDYSVDVNDTTWVEDISLFGYNQKTGLPNRLKVLISEIVEDMDNPSRNSIKVQNFTTQFEDLFQQVSASIQSLTYNENIYKRSSNFTSLQNISENSLQGTLDSNNLTLINTQENNISLDASGQRGSDINNHSNKYKSNGQGIFFSNNGGQSWNTGVGPSGINADYIKVGTLDAGKVQIVDGEYLYFTWDKSGINAYRDPTAVNSTSNNSGDFISFNRYGLSVVENGQIRLRSGYNFTGTNGLISTENEVGENVGFYLYNTGGDAILQTAVGRENMNKDTARILLQGEMYITDSSLDSEEQKEETITYYTYKTRHQTESVAAPQLEQTTESNNLIIGAPLQRAIDIPYCIINNQVYHNYVKKYTLTLTGSTTTSTKIYYILGSQNITAGGTLNNVIYYKELPSSTSSIRISRSSEVNEYTSTQRGIAYDLYIQNEANRMTKTTAYYINGNYYTEELSSSQIEKSEAVGLFLNNKISLDSTVDKDYQEKIKNKYTDKRVISAVTKTNNNINNILTVLKDGTLAIGGSIKDDNLQNLSNLTDIPTIQNPKIVLTTAGKLQMDFSNFEDFNGHNLINVISSNISQTIESIPPHFHYFEGDWGSEVIGDWDNNLTYVGKKGDGESIEDYANRIGETLDKLIDKVADIYRNLSDRFFSTLNGTQNTSI